MNRCFKITYCENFTRRDFDSATAVCEHFIQQVKEHNPLLAIKLSKISHDPASASVLVRLWTNVIVQCQKVQ